MKRKIAWLTLPLILCAFMLGLKWRAEHPPTTKEDLGIRAFILKSMDLESTEAQLIHSSWDGGHRFRTDHESKIAIKELTPFIAEIHLIPWMRDVDFIGRRVNGRIRITFLRSDITTYRAQIIFDIDMDTNEGKLFYNGNASNPRQPSLPIEESVHPVTVKRWIKMLLDHPRIGPELRAQMKS